MRKVSDERLFVYWNLQAQRLPRIRRVQQIKRNRRNRTKKRTELNFWRASRTNGSAIDNLFDDLNQPIANTQINLNINRNTYLDVPLFWALWPLTRLICLCTGLQQTQSSLIAHISK